MVARIIYSTACLLISCATIFVYSNAIGARLNYKYDPGLRTLREDGIFIAYTGVVLFILISQLFFKKIIRTTLWKIIATTLFLITLEEALFNIAFGLRAEFGATWTNAEVRLELVFSYWQSTVMLAVSLTCFIGLLWYLTKMDKKNGRIN